jgi:CxxC motif-containing protein (DUF1111 family)
VISGLIALVIGMSAGLGGAVGLRQRNSNAGATVAVPAPKPGPNIGCPAGSEASTAIAAATTEPPAQTTVESQTATEAEECDDIPPTAEEADQPPTEPSAPPEPAEEPARPAAVGDPNLGRELFARRWSPDDPRCHGGDGLGPVYNATSCLDCHGLGGPGGGGRADRNVDLVSVIGIASRPRIPRVVLATNFPAIGRPDYLVNPLPANRLDDEGAALLTNFHPGFRDSRGVVLHRSGVEPNYSRWRQGVETRLRAHRMATSLNYNNPSRWFAAGLIGRMVIARTQRNAPALFGAGQIDAVPNRAFYWEARQQPPEIRGRVQLAEGGRVGRFGLKAQIGSLREFVLTACANELGLEVPGHHQAASPLDPGAQAKGVDLTGDECDALTAYVRNLPAPVVEEPSKPEEALAVEEGRNLFIEIGCAGCHSPSFAGIQGIYSDLLLHDMGQGLSSQGSYYGSTVSTGAASQSEWRTPPLWGVRDSGPYLHDGRAHTLSEAVIQHSGQGKASARAFVALSQSKQSKLRAFLNSLVAPPDPSGSPDPTSAAVEDPATSEAARRAASKLRLAQNLERTGKSRGALDFYRQAVREAPESPSGRLAAERICLLEEASPVEPRPGPGATGTTPGAPVVRGP